MGSQLIAELLSLYAPTGLLDWEAYRQQIRRVAPYVTGLLVGGLAGDGLQLSAIEFSAQMRAAHDEARGLPVWQGVLASSSLEALRKIDEACKARAVGVVVSGPVGQTSWSEATQRYWDEVLTSASLPVIIYDEPKITARCPSVTVAKLLQHPVVVGYKDSTKDVIHAACVSAHLSGKDYYSGSDGLTWPLMAMGACGVISLLVDPFPQLLRRLTTEAEALDVVAARATHQVIVQLRHILTQWPNQDGYKIVLHTLGIGMMPEEKVNSSGLSPSVLIQQVSNLKARYPAILNTW